MDHAATTLPSLTGLIVGQLATTARAMKTKLLTLFTAKLPLMAIAQISYNGGVYTQDFNTLNSASIYTYYTNLAPGWHIKAILNSYVWTPVTNGYSDNYGVYCFSLESGATDKSIGLVQGTTGPSYLGARFRNTSGVTFRAFSLSYVVEQWRKGAVTANDQSIPFSYSLNAADLASGTFVSVPALDMHSIHDGEGVAATLNGNTASNRQSVASTVAGISWLPGQDLWVRWSGVGYPFLAAHALAIDDISFRAVPSLQISSTSLAGLGFSWSTNYPGYSLQSSVTPTATSWVAVTNAPATSGSEFSVEIEARDAPRFFRLKAQ